MQASGWGLTFMAAVIVVGVVTCRVRSDESRFGRPAMLAFVALALVAVLFAGVVLAARQQWAMPIFAAASLVVPVAVYAGVSSHVTRSASESTPRHARRSSPASDAPAKAAKPVAAFAPIDTERPKQPKKTFGTPAAIGGDFPVPEEETPTHDAARSAVSLPGWNSAAALAASAGTHASASDAAGCDDQRAENVPTASRTVASDAPTAVIERIEATSAPQTGGGPEPAHESEYAFEPEDAPAVGRAFVVEPAFEPEPAPEHAVESQLPSEHAVEPAADSAPEPALASGSAFEPAPEHAVELAAEPAAEPAFEPAPAFVSEPAPEPEPALEPAVSVRVTEPAYAAASVTGLASQAEATPPASREPSSEDCFEKARALRAKGAFPIAARLFKEGAARASGDAEEQAARFEELACYVKAGQVEQARMLADELRGRGDRLSFAERIKLDAVARMM